MSVYNGFNGLVIWDRLWGRPETPLGASGRMSPALEEA